MRAIVSRALVMEVSLVSRVAETKSGVPIGMPKIMVPSVVVGMVVMRSESCWTIQIDFWRFRVKLISFSSAWRVEMISSACSAVVHMVVSSARSKILARSLNLVCKMRRTG